MRTLLLIFLVTLLATACAEHSGEPAEPPGVPTTAARISGIVNYRERIALSNRAQLEIVLEDVSRQDAAAIVIAEKTVVDPGQVPFRFELEYSPDAIDPGHAYALRLRIREQGRIRFINDAALPVLTSGAGRTVDAMLVQVGGWQPNSRQAAPVAGRGAVLRGMFRYLADAAQFRDCRTNLLYPVAMEGAYMELEHAYLDSGITGGEWALAEVTGRYLERPSMEQNHRKVKLIADEFHNLIMSETCISSARAELVGTYWKLIEVGGQSVRPNRQGREAHFILDASELRVHGNGGCNNFFGGYESGDGTLSFGPIGSTRMACTAGMDTERALLAVLEQANRYKIEGLVLSLYDDQQPLARFEAVY